jgi:aubergine-like protein
MESAIAIPKFVQRPQCSPRFKPQIVDVVCNHYDFTLGEKGKIYQWDVKFDPDLEKDSREVRNEIFARNRKDIIKKVGLFIRTGDILFTFSPSNLGETLIGPFEGHGKYKLYIKYINKMLDFGNMDAPDDSRMQIFKVVNSGVKSIMKNLGYTEFGFSRKFYDLKKEQKIHNGDWILDIKSGFFTSIDLYQNKVPKLLVDCTSRILRVYSLWEEYSYFKEKGLPHDEILTEYIEGKNFMASYGNNRVYKIDGVEKTMTPLSPFPDLSKAKTFKEYLLKQYGQKVQDDKQFMVYSIRLNKQMVEGQLRETEEKVWLVPEFLKPCGLTDELRSDKTAMQEIAKFTKLIPDSRDQRQQNLIKLINNLAGKGDKGSLQNEIGLRIDPKSNRIKGKLLNYPEIRLSKPMIPDRGNFIIKNKIFDQTAKLERWLLIANNKDTELAGTFALKIKEASSALGIVVDKPKVIGVVPEKGSNLSDLDIIKVIEKTPGAKMVVIFLPKQNADRVYKRVKAYCNQQLGVPSQFFTNWSFKFTKNIDNLSVASKVLIQMCAKMKAKIWKVQMPIDINVNGHQTMIVGADVFHKSMHESVTSVVSTYDKDFTSYYSQTSVQKRKGDDTLYNIAESVKNAARRYVKENKAPPNLIVVFRDGVGQSQIDSVREKEVQTLVKGLQNEFNGHNVKLAYIIVTKRLSDRFFVENGNKLDNPSGGLIIDTTVVKDNFDYFMVAQAVTQGTATPTNYNVIFNNTDLKAESFYELTYHQCFSYYNWSGPLKVPAVIMMANKLADVVGQTHSGKQQGGYKDTAEALKDSLFFL